LDGDCEAEGSEAAEELVLFGSGIAAALDHG
jgi:hypothetical protein